MDHGTKIPLLRMSSIFWVDFKQEQLRVEFNDSLIKNVTIHLFVKK